MSGSFGWTARWHRRLLASTTLNRADDLVDWTTIDEVQADLGLPAPEAERSINELWLKGFIEIDGRRIRLKEGGLEP